MKTFHMIKKAQAVIEPILGRDSMIGLIFQLFEGLRDMIERATQTKGFRTIQHVEDKLLKMFEGDDRNPYFEAVYMAYFHYYNEVANLEGQDNCPNAHKQIVIYLEKALKVQLAAYGKYHSAVFNTLAGLAESYFRLH